MAGDRIPELYDLSGKVAVVTGGLGLIGEHLCFALAEAGATVVVTDRDGDAPCAALAAKLPGEAVGMGVEITAPESLQALTDALLARFGQIDVLVNTAAINEHFGTDADAAERSKFENFPLDIWEAMLKVNVTGTFLAAQIIGREMAKRGQGSIINVASTYGIVAPDQSLYTRPDGTQPFFKSPAYPTTKGAVIQFTRFLAAYWGTAGVRVNTLSPGGVYNHQDDYFVENYSRRTPLGRMATPADYKGAVVFLASDASRYMTGANLVVDGGWTAW